VTLVNTIRAAARNALYISLPYKVLKIPTSIYSMTSFFFNVHAALAIHLLKLFLGHQHNKVSRTVSLTGRNCTGLPFSVGRRTAHASGRRSADRLCVRRLAGPTAGSVMDNKRRRQTTDDSVQNNTSPLRGPVISIVSRGKNFVVEKM